MSLVQLGTPVPQANVKLVDIDALQAELKRQIEGEVRFDQISRALYSSDASVYQIQPLGVVIPKNREDIIRVVEICGRFRCPITMRGGRDVASGADRSARAFKSIRRNTTTMSSK